VYSPDYTLSQDICLSLRLSRSGIVYKRLNIPSKFFHRLLTKPRYTIQAESLNGNIEHTSGKGNYSL